MKLKQFETLTSRSTASVKQRYVMLHGVDNHNVEMKRH